MSIEIIADDREKYVIPFLKEQSDKLNISYKVERINIGDFAISYNNRIVAIIERKTWVDLAQSMRDGRKQNIQKLLDLRKQTGCLIVYLIEGIACPPEKSFFSNIPYRYLRSHLDHLIFRDGVSVMHSSSHEYSAFRLLELARNYLTLDKKIIDKKIIDKATFDKTPDKTLGGSLDKVQTVIDDSIVIKDGSVDDDDSDTSNNSDDDSSSESSDSSDEENNENNENNESKTTKVIELSADDILDELLLSPKQSPKRVTEEKSKPKIKGSSDSVLSQLKQKAEVTPDVIARDVLSALPCIGHVIADILLKSNMTLACLMDSDINDIASLSYEGGKKIGAKTAEKILAKVQSLKHRYDKKKKPVLNKYDINIKIFTTLPQISKASAIEIANVISVRDVIDGKVTKKIISGIYKSTKTKVGDKCASDIIKYLQYKK